MRDLIFTDDNGTSICVNEHTDATHIRAILAREDVVSIDYVYTDGTSCSWTLAPVPSGQWEYRVPEEGEWFVWISDVNKFHPIACLVQRTATQDHDARDKRFVITTGHMEGRL